MKICLAGEGAQGTTHIEALQGISGVEVVTLAGGVEADTAAFARKWNIPHFSLDLVECLEQPNVEAVILTTPNQIHADQTELSLEMGKHVLVELPMGLTIEESRRVAAAEKKSGLVCMVCHTSRYSGAFREVRRRLRSSELDLHHIVQETFFFRRTNENRFGKPRTWTDELLWHQACHTIDMVYWLLEDPDIEVWGQAGPDHKQLGIPMDITIGMRSKSGVIVSAAMSFNNHGPIQSRWRFIGEQQTLLASWGQLTDHEGSEIKVDEGGVDVQNAEFFDAIREGRQPLTSCSACLPVMEIIDRIQCILDN